LNSWLARLLPPPADCTVFRCRVPGSRCTHCRRRRNCEVPSRRNNSTNRKGHASRSQP
jgi:hypothetical protein